VNAPVIDHTGLKGIYDFYLDRGRDTPTPPLTSDSAASDPSGPTLFAAIQSQLGLKMAPEKGDIEMVVVDHANRQPSGN